MDSTAARNRYGAGASQTARLGGGVTPTNTMIFHEDANIRGLAAAVILNALRDMTSRKNSVAVEALLWIYSDEYLMFAGVCGMPDTPKINPLKKIVVNVRGRQKRKSLNKAVKEILIIRNGVLKEIYTPL